MDPVTIWLFCLATAWVVRHLAVDGWAELTGRGSPRLARRRAQHELAEKQRADLGRPTIRQAVSGQIATAIAKPREKGPLLRFLAELWQDAWVDAADWHRQRRANRTRPDEPKRAMSSRLCAGGCGRWVSGQWTHCSACEDDLTADPPDWWAEDEPATDEPDEITDAELVDDPTPDQPIDPEPTPAPEPTRKDTPPMPTTTINGDTASPLENLEYATGCMKLSAALGTELDTIINNLTAAGVGSALLWAVTDVKAAGERFHAAAEGARLQYADHVATQADIAGDNELRNTVVGTYLDSANA